jgi:RNA polymerase sigma-70 factor (ECF subfamily)
VAKADSFEARSNVSTWLLAIARCKTHSALRRRTVVQLRGDFAATIEDDPESTPDEKDRSALLRRCLTRLSSAHREVIDLVYYHEKSVEDVAEIVGIPTSCVTTRMHAARNRTAELLKKTGIDLACV